MSERSQELAELIRDGEPEEAVLYQLMALLDGGSKQYEPVHHACMLGLASSQYRGCLHRTWAQQSLLNEYEGWGIRVPHPKTTSSHLPRFQSPEFKEYQIYGLNPTELWNTINGLLRDQLVAIVDVLDLKPHDWVVTIDTNVRPNYSKLGNQAFKGRLVPQGLTPSAKFATGQGRSHGPVRLPLHDGTLLGDEYIVCFAHHTRTGATFPVGVVDCANLAYRTSDAVRTLLRQLEGLPAPLLVLADREFYGVDVSRGFNEECKRLGTSWMVPVRRSGKEAQNPHPGKLSVPTTIKRCYPKAKPVPHDPDVRYHMEQRAWPKDPNVKFTLLVFFRRKSPDQEESPLAIDLGPYGLPTDRYATAFITNFPVHPDLILWLSEQYHRRWAAECAWAALEHNFGYSPSKLLNLKFLVYGLNLVQYGLHSVWRFRASRELGRSMDDPLLGLAPYLELLRRRLDLARFVR